MTETSPVAPQEAFPQAAFLPERALIALAGPDARHFLHNLVTANIEALTPGSGTFAALLTPQGKIIADMLILDASDEEPLFLIDVAQGFAEDLQRRLALYKLRAQVSIDLLGPPIAVAVLFGATPEGEDFYAFADPRHPELGTRLYGPEDVLAGALASHPRIGAEGYHARRIALGVPECGKDYMPLSTFPHEANLDQLGAVDFRKGCYIGQEIVSRMEHRGTARTRALRVTLLNGFGVSSGAELRAGERVIGHVGECLGDRAIGLARLDRIAEAEAAGEDITAGGVPVALARPGYARFEMKPGS